jgi:hypothetical protein
VFDLGKRYDIRTIDPGAPDEGITTHPNCKVVDYQHPLLKLSQSGRDEWIVNTAAPTFVDAIARH